MASYSMNKNRKNFCKLSRAIIDLSSDVLRAILDSHTKPQDLANTVRIFNPSEILRINQAAKDGSYKKFDISFLYKILRCVCNQDICDHLSKQITLAQIINTLQKDPVFVQSLTPDELNKVKQIGKTGLYGGCNDGLLHKLYIHFCKPQPKLIHPSKGWGNTPDTNDTELGDDIERIREIRNALYGHIPSTEISDTDFISNWNQLDDIMKRVNTHLQQIRGNKDFKKDLDEIYSSNMDEEKERDYIDEIKRLEKFEEDLSKRMDETEMIVADLSKKREKDIEKVESLSLRTENLATETNEKHEVLYHRMTNFDIELTQTNDKMKEMENTVTGFQMTIQERDIRQEEVDSDLVGLKKGISVMDTKVQQAVDTTKLMEGTLQTVQKDVSKLKEHAKDPSKNTPRKRTTAEQVTLDRINHIVNSGIFYETKAIKKGEDILKRNGVVVFSGLPGQGKTEGAFYLLHLFQQKNPDWIFVHFTIKDMQNWRESLENNTKTVMLLDDILGRTNTNDGIINQGEHYLQDIFSVIKSGKLKVILTSRKHILQSNMSKLEKYDLFSSKNIIDMSNQDYQLTNEEKEGILKNHLKLKHIEICMALFDGNYKQAEQLDENLVIKIDQYEVNKIVCTNPAIGFPLSCFLFCSYKKYTKQGAKFFNKPNKFLKDEINSMISEDSKPIEKIQYLLMSYMMLKEGEIDEGLTEIDRSIFDEIVNSLSLKMPSKRQIKEAIVGINERYIVKLNNRYTFKHQTIFESVAICFCDDNVALSLKACNRHFISEFIRPQNFDAPEGEVVVLLDREDYKHLIPRIKYSLQHKEIRDDTNFPQWRGDWYGWWSSHPLMDDKKFIDLVIKEIQCDEETKSILKRCVDDDFGGLFYCACMSGKTHLIDSLYKKLQLDISKFDASDCLRVASLQGHTSTVLWLLDNNIGIQTIMEALKWAKKPETLTTIISHPKLTKDHMKRALNISDGRFVFYCDNTTINALLQRWPNIEQKYLFELFHSLCFKNQDQVVDTIFRRRPDFIIPAFMSSCLGGFTSAVKVLLDKKPDVITEQHVKEGFIGACFTGYFNVVDLLLSTKTQHIITLQILKQGFGFACAGGGTSIVQYLLQRFVASSIHKSENNENLTNVHIAAFFGRANVCGFLNKYGLNVTDVSKSGRSTLDYAMLGFKYMGMGGNAMAATIKKESCLLWQYCCHPGWSVAKSHPRHFEVSHLSNVFDFTQLLLYLIGHKDSVCTDLSMILDDENCTLAHYCVVYNSQSVIELISKTNRSALLCQNTKNHKPIHLAVLMGRHDIFKLLLPISLPLDSANGSHSVTTPITDELKMYIELGKQYAGKTFPSQHCENKPEFLNFLPDGHNSISFENADCYNAIERELNIEIP